MEAVIFIGIQASGKSTFYREHFLDTHIRINLDMLKTRHREKLIFEACLEAKQNFVIDNTNPTLAERQRYISAAKEHNFTIIAYYFFSDLESCKQRNELRHIKQKIPVVGIISTYKKLEKPSYKEGFDRIYTVKIDSNYSFIVEEYRNEI
ncbi:MAG: AAA family ATPase [Prochloraceae cyanobacterium]